MEIQSIQNMRFYTILSLTWAVLDCFSLSAQSTHTPLREGDRAYDRVQYKDAEKHYRKAADRDVGNAKAVYNLGNTLYQQGKFEDAAQRFQQVASIDQDPANKADALHNLGDAYLKQRKFKEAVRSYEESLRVRPADPGTKQNLQMAKKKLKEEEQKEKEQQEKNQQQNQDPNQPSQENQPNQPNQPDKQPNQPKPDQHGQPQQPKSEEQKEQDVQKLKKEDAKRLLETAVGPDDRKNAQKYRATQQQTKPKGAKKDW
jgi:Ca-activated chloride channel family protein